MRLLAHFTLLALLSSVTGCSAEVLDEERCNGIDDDGDGLVDEEAIDAVQVWADADADGYGRGDPSWSCETAAMAVQGGDCDDSNPNAWPGRPELCNGIDDDCDGIITNDERDDDDDGWPACWDCDDGNARVHPEAPEFCNGRDDNCDDAIDEQPQDGVTHYEDLDGDGFGEEATKATTCAVPEGRALVGQDCDDTNAEAHPEHRERCDDVDHDCNGDPSPALSIPSDVKQLDDAIARSSPGQTICLEAGNHSLSRTEVHGVWVEGVGDDTVLRGILVLHDDSGLLHVQTDAPVVVAGDGVHIEGLHLRDAVLTTNGTPTDLWLQDLSISDGCTELRLNRYAVHGLGVHDVQGGACAMAFGDVYDLEMHDVSTVLPGPTSSLLMASNVYGAQLHDVAVTNGSLLSANSVTEVRGQHVQLKFSQGIRADNAHDVVLVDTIAEASGVLMLATTAQHITLDRTTIVGDYSYYPLVSAPQSRWITLHDVQLDVKTMAVPLIRSDYADHIDVRDVRTQGVFLGVLSSSWAKLLASNVVVAGVRVDRAAAGIVTTGAVELAHATITGVEGDGPLLGLGLQTGLHLDVSQVDVTDLSADGTVNYCNTWDVGDADWASSASDMHVDPAYVDRTSQRPTMWDLHLSATSALRDAGDPLGATDDDGSTADIGAYGGPTSSEW